MGLPILRLASLLVDSSCLDASIEYSDILLDSLNKFMEMLKTNYNLAKIEDEELQKFLQNCLNRLKESDEIKRKNILKVCDFFFFE
jgi:hypothetical protein